MAELEANSHLTVEPVLFGCGLLEGRDTLVVTEQLSNSHALRMKTNEEQELHFKSCLYSSAAPLPSNWLSACVKLLA